MGNQQLIYDKVNEIDQGCHDILEELSKIKTQLTVIEGASTTISTVLQGALLVKLNKIEQKIARLSRLNTVG